MGKINIFEKQLSSSEPVFVYPTLYSAAELLQLEKDLDLAGYNKVSTYAGVERWEKHCEEES